MPQELMIRCATAALLAFALPAAADAQSCSIADIPGLEFGVYDPFLPSASKADVPIIIACDTGSVDFTVEVAGSAGSRTLGRSGGGSAIAYTLRDRDGTVLGQGGGTLSGSTSSGGEGSVRIYGEIEAGQNVRVGSYADAPMLIVSLLP